MKKRQHKRQIRRAAARQNGGEIELKVDDAEFAKSMIETIFERRKRLEYMGHIHDEEGNVHEMYRKISFVERFVKFGVIAMCVISVAIFALAVVSILLQRTA